MNRSELARWTVPILLGILVTATFRDYGYSGDEHTQNRWYGQAVLRFMTSLGEDRSAATTRDYALYGGTFDVAAELLVAVSPLSPRNTRHLANVLAGLAGIAGCWVMARRLGGSGAGAWAVLFLAVCAPWYGHMFINAKDIPFAAGYVWSLVLSLRAAEELPRPRLATLVRLGLVLGLTLGVRIGGVLVLGYLGLMVMAFAGWSVLRRGEAKDFLRAHALRLVTSLLLVTGIAWLVMLVCWPAALLHPIAAPLAAFRAASDFNWAGSMLWNGRFLQSNALPWTYLPVSFAVQLPEALVFLFGASLVWGMVRLGRWLRDDLPAADMPGVTLLLVAILFPVAWAMARHSVLYDRGRHFLFVLPPLACLAALFWTWLLERAGEARRGLRPLLPGLMICALAVPTARMAALHPYEYAYLNAFAGGMPDGARRFETEYWFTSYREAIQLMLAHAKAVSSTYGVPFSRSRFTVAVAGVFPEGIAEELPENFRVFPASPWPEVRADYLVASTRWGMDQWWPDWKEVATIDRAGMRFAVLKAEPEFARRVPQAPPPTPEP